MCFYNVPTRERTSDRFDLVRTYIWPKRLFFKKNTEIAVLIDKLKSEVTEVAVRVRFRCRHT